MKKNPKFIAFSTQKGGAGKTTLTVLVASYLHYTQGLNVLIVDGDYPQHSIAEMRERDLKMVMEDDYYKLKAYDQLNQIGKKAYPVIESTAENALKDAEEAIESSDIDFDFVFFDLAGTVNSGGVISTLSYMDYIFAPICADRLVLESTLRFAVVLNENLITTGRSAIKGLNLIWNMVDGREKTDLYNVYENIIGELGLSVLETFIPDSKRFRREISGSHRALFRSTLFPTDKQLLKGSNIDSLCKEILELIK